MSPSPSPKSGFRTSKPGRPWVVGHRIRDDARVVSAVDEETALDDWERRRGGLTLFSP